MNKKIFLSVFLLILWAGSLPAVNQKLTLEKISGVARFAIELDAPSPDFSGSFTCPSRDGMIRVSGSVVRGRKTGEWKFYFTGGAGIIWGRGHFRDGDPDGTWLEYFPSGKVHVEENFREGQLEGSRTVFYESGMARLQENYREGMKSGKNIEYHENGINKENAFYIGGLRTGMSTAFYPSGKKMHFGPYLKGRKHGKWEYYSEEGRLQSRGYYHNDSRTGTWEFFDEGSRKSREEKY